MWWGMAAGPGAQGLRDMPGPRRTDYSLNRKERKA